MTLLSKTPPTIIPTYTNRPLKTTWGVGRFASWSEGFHTYHLLIGQSTSTWLDLETWIWWKLMAFFKSFEVGRCATSKDWYDLVSSFLNFVYVHRAVRMNTGRLHGIFLCFFSLDQVATWCFMFTPSWLGNCSKTWTGVWGPASLGVAKVVKGPGMVGWITWVWGKSEIHLTFAARKMPFCWFPTKQRSELKTCPGDTMLSGGLLRSLPTAQPWIVSPRRAIGPWPRVCWDSWTLSSQWMGRTWWHSGRPHDSGGWYRELYLPIEV